MIRDDMDIWQMNSALSGLGTDILFRNTGLASYWRWSDSRAGITGSKRVYFYHAQCNSVVGQEGLETLMDQL